MTSPARSDPTAPARELGERAVSGARELVEGFRRSGRFFKMRVAVVAGWAALSLLTMWAACPSSGPTNRLGADVQVTATALLGEQLSVRNESDEIWTDVVVTLDDGRRYEQKTVRPHGHLVLSMSQFKKAEQGAPGDLKPRSVTIECGQGRFTTRLDAR